MFCYYIINKQKKSIHCELVVDVGWKNVRGACHLTTTALKIWWQQAEILFDDSTKWMILAFYDGNTEPKDSSFRDVFNCILTATILMREDRRQNFDEDDIKYNWQERKQLKDEPPQCYIFPAPSIKRHLSGGQLQLLVYLFVVPQDHVMSGFLPDLAKEGFWFPNVCTPYSTELLRSGDRYRLPCWKHRDALWKP